MVKTRNTLQADTLFDDDDVETYHHATGPIQTHEATADLHVGVS